MSIAERAALDVIEGLASAGMGAHTDAVYIPPDGGQTVLDVYVIVEDLVSETTGEVTQGGALLSIPRSQVVATQGGQLDINGEVWRINRRVYTTDPAMIQYEASK